MVRAEYQESGKIPTTTAISRRHWPDGRLGPCYTLYTHTFKTDWRGVLLKAGVINEHGRASNGETYKFTLPNQHTEGELIAILQKLAMQVGHSPSQADLRHMISQGMLYPTPIIFTNHFGTWEKGLAAADLVVYRVGRPKLKGHWSTHKFTDWSEQRSHES